MGDKCKSAEACVDVAVYPEWAGVNREQWGEREQGGEEGAGVKREQWGKREQVSVQERHEASLLLHVAWRRRTTERELGSEGED